MGLVVAIFVPGFPDQALQGFQWGGFAVFADPLQQFGDECVCIVGADVFIVFRCEFCRLLQGDLNFFVVNIFSYERGQVGCRVRKKYVFNEGNRRRGAFDIGQDQFDVCLLYTSDAADDP